MIKTVSFAICCVVLAGGALAQTPSTAQPDAAPVVAEKPAATAAPENSATPGAKPAAAKPETAPAKPETAPKKGRTMDRLELDPTAITGNRELPKVLYIVPWKKSDLGNLAGRPTNTLLDEVLTPVDREVFRRQTDYYTKLNAQAGNPSENQAAEKPGAIESK